ncbi:MAG: outer membrane protein assembly factor BamB family protein [Thermoleophilia bacterium]
MILTIAMFMATGCAETKTESDQNGLSTSPASTVADAEELTTNVFFRGNNERTGAFDEKGTTPAGTLKWKYSTGSKAVKSTPAVANGIAYVGGEDGIHAVDMKDGKLLWKAVTGDWVVSSPIVVDGTVYFGGGWTSGGQADAPRGFDKNIYAYDAKTGVEKWRRGVMSYVESSPAVVNGIVYVGSWDRNVYAIDSGTGTIKWQYKTKGQVLSSPAVSMGTVFIGSGFTRAADDKNLYAIDAATGSLKWSFPTGWAVSSTPAVSGGAVYFSGEDKKLYAVDATTGMTRWAYTVNDFSSPAVSNGVVYAGNNRSGLIALDSTTGTQVWSFAIPSIQGSVNIQSPIVSNGIVYFGYLGTSNAGAGEMVAVDSLTGKQNWSFKPGKGVTSSAVIADGKILFGSEDGYLYALD